MGVCSKFFAKILWIAYDIIGIICMGFVMIVAVSEALIVKLGLYLLLPAFILFLIFIMWDISKKSKAGRAGTFWIFVALGMGFFGFMAKGVIEWVLTKWFI